MYEMLLSNHPLLNNNAYLNSEKKKIHHQILKCVRKAEKCTFQASKNILNEACIISGWMEEIS